MRHFISAVLALTTVRAVSAQQAADTSRLAPIVVTASRTDATQLVATAATTVLRGDALRARGVETVTAALREVPGATIVQTGGPGSQASLFLRGGEADYVQVMIDGVTVNEPGGAFNFANLSLDNVERIEVVRGPGSALYGSSAVAGVIQIFTRSGGGARTGELRLRGGQRGLLDAEANAGRQWGTTGFWIGAGHHASGGIYDLNNDSRNSTVSGRLRLAPGAASVVTVTGRYADARYDYPTEYYGAPLDSNSYSTERRLTAGIDMRHAVSPSVDLKLAIGSSRLHGVTNDPIDARTGDTPDDGSATPFETVSLRYNADAQVDLRIMPAATLTIGVDHDWQRFESAGEDPETDPLLARWSRAGYGQLVGNLASRLSYTLGGRYEDNERFGGLGYVRAGAGLLVGTSTTVRASAGTAFKEPQFIEITGGGFAQPNPELRPERSTSWEATLEQRFIGDALALSATWFDQDFEDLIVYTPLPVSTGYFAQYRNAREAVANGWEFEARAAVAERATIRASYTNVHGEARATATSPAEPLLRRPTRIGSVVVTAPMSSRFVLTADASYIGPRPDIRFFPGDPFQASETLPAYTLVGIGGVHALPSFRGDVGLELMVRVDNLLDERYEAVAGFATPRRTASIGVRMAIGR